MKNAALKGLKICNIHDTNFNTANILKFLEIVDDEFYPSLSSRVDLKEWVNKLFEKSYTLVAYNPNSESNDIIALLCFYCNDHVNSYSYIPALGVLKDYRRSGLAKLMFEKCFQILKNMGIKTLGIKTWNGSTAYSIYHGLGFTEVSKKMDRPNGVYSIYLEVKF